MPQPKQQQQQEEEIPVLLVDDKRVQLIPVDELELEQIEMIEEEFDAPIEDIDFRRVKALRFLIYFSMRRVDPKITMADLASVRVNQVATEEEATANGGPRKARPPKAKAD